MIESAVRNGDFEAPWRSTPQVFEFFRDEAELLRHLQREWRTALAGAVYVAIEAGDGDLQHDVMRALDKTRTRLGGARRILQAHADHPAIAGAMRKERALLSCFIGVAADELSVA
jgi:hypothetical protein